MKRFILVVIFFLIFTPFIHLNAQWLKNYGLGSASSIQQTSDGGYIVAGSTLSLGAGGDAILLKLDSAGDIEWIRYYGGDGQNYDVAASSIQQTSDGGYIIAGRAGASWFGPRYFLVIKLDSAGDIEWQRDYGGDEDDYAYSIQQTNDGGYIVAGDTNSFGAGGRDAWILKLDSAGDIEWQRAYGGSDNDGASSIQQTSDGGYIFSGYNTSLSEWGFGAICVIKLDSAGDIEWQKTYGGTNYRVLSIQQTNDGGYIVAGGTNSFGAGGRDAWILKLDSAGDIEWQRAYGGSEDDSASSIQQTSDGGYIVAGDTFFSNGGDDCLFFKLDSAGDIEWYRTLGEDDSDDYSARSIRQTSDGGYIVVGYRSATTGGGYPWMTWTTYNIWVLKLFSDGDIHTPCEPIRSSSATITDTFISPEVLYLSYQDTNVTPLDTDFSAESSNTTVDVLCPEQTSDYEDDDSGKKCFIATAAYCSPLHPYVSVLRDFRDTYLMPNKLGRKLVYLYYKYSPFVADLIAENKALKVAVRISLLPIIAFSYSMVHFGPIITLVIFVFIFILPLFFISFWRKGIIRKLKNYDS